MYLSCSVLASSRIQGVESSIVRSSSNSKCTIPCPLRRHSHVLAAEGHQISPFDTLLAADLRSTPPRCPRPPHRYLNLLALKPYEASGLRVVTLGVVNIRVRHRWTSADVRRRRTGAEGRGSAQGTPTHCVIVLVAPYAPRIGALDAGEPVQSQLWPSHLRRTQLLTMSTTTGPTRKHSKAIDVATPPEYPTSRPHRRVMTPQLSRSEHFGTPSDPFICPHPTRKRPPSVDSSPNPVPHTSRTDASAPAISRWRIPARNYASYPFYTSGGRENTKTSAACCTRQDDAASPDSACHIADVLFSTNGAASKHTLRSKFKRVGEEPANPITRTAIRPRNPTAARPGNAALSQPRAVRPAQPPLLKHPIAPFCEGQPGRALRHRILHASPLMPCTSTPREIATIAWHHPALSCAGARYDVLKRIHEDAIKTPNAARDTAVPLPERQPPPTLRRPKRSQDVADIDAAPVSAASSAICVMSDAPPSAANNLNARRDCIMRWFRSPAKLWHGARCMLVNTGDRRALNWHPASQPMPYSAISRESRLEREPPTFYSPQARR
ncbi:hypothetical protein HYPSUDRAFT_203761 [Hypholoma sublateritium FD-334 SS-4]|uniref:Uncharacterized protein n=1 Tax=Hypholoma sublateritium (strain FD-334 SS-4) TaxID=945553 RepID=A0A0D2NNP5_HYPSF|nr:hypothetical protein HYPSUDRAFT_203761 [Hypholoma sublateritium FD-334 SS-4]